MWHLRVQVKHSSINKESRFLKRLKIGGYNYNRNCKFMERNILKAKKSLHN